MEKGNLIVSTKSSKPWRLVAVGIISAICIFIGITCLLEPEIFRDLSRDSYELIAYILGMVIICYAVLQFLLVWNGQRSFVSVYDHCVEGFTAPENKSGLKIQFNQEKFQISYSDIQNVSLSKTQISIQTAYRIYLVQALENRDIAVAEIRKRISAKH